MLIGVLSVLFTACHSLSADGRRVQHTLQLQQTEVTSLLSDLQPLLERGSLDSMLAVSHSHPDIVFYVYDSRNLRFWSHNWLVANGLYRVRYNEWWLGRFDNAIGVGRWTQLGEYSVCTIIPLKFSFAQYNRAVPCRQPLAHTTPTCQ